VTYNGYALDFTFVGLFEPLAAKTSAIAGQVTVLPFSTRRGWVGAEIE